jgi:hypothetical protein
MIVLVTVAPRLFSDDNISDGQISESHISDYLIKHTLFPTSMKNAFFLTAL